MLFRSCRQIVIVFVVDAAAGAGAGSVPVVAVVAVDGSLNQVKSGSSNVLIRLGHPMWSVGLHNLCHRSNVVRGGKLALGHLRITLVFCTKKQGLRSPRVSVAPWCAQVSPWCAQLNEKHERGDNGSAVRRCAQGGRSTCLVVCFPRGGRRFMALMPVTMTATLGFETGS